MDQITLKISQAKQKITPVIKRYRVWLIILASILIVGGFWLKVNGLINVERDEPTYQSALSKSDIPKFNQATLDKIKALRDSGAKNPGTDYSNNRTNPFAE